MAIKKEYIKNLQGKDFVLYAGLLDEAHRIGLLKIKTDLFSYDGDTAIVTATAFMKDGKEFDGIGDADSKNCSPIVIKHRIRMAETRAKARALRDACNIDMCTVEELGGDVSRKYIENFTAPETSIEIDQKMNEKFIRFKNAWEKSDKSETTRDRAIIEAKKNGVYEKFIQYLKGKSDE